MAPSPPGPDSGPMLLRVNRTIVGVMTAAVVVFPLVALLTLEARDDPPAMWLVLPLAAGVVVAVLCATLGFRVPPLEPGRGDDRGRALAAFQSSTILRAALAESPAVLGLTSAFVAGSALPAVIGSVVSLVLLGVFAWPGRATISRLERRLDAKGGRSRLAETLLGPSGPSGPSGAVTYH